MRKAVPAALALIPLILAGLASVAYAELHKIDLYVGRGGKLSGTLQFTEDPGITGMIVTESSVIDVDGGSSVEIYFDSYCHLDVSSGSTTLQVSLQNCHVSKIVVDGEVVVSDEEVLSGDFWAVASSFNSNLEIIVPGGEKAYTHLEVDGRPIIYDLSSDEIRVVKLQPYMSVDIPFDESYVYYYGYAEAVYVNGEVVPEITLLTPILAGVAGLAAIIAAARRMSRPREVRPELPVSTGGAG